MQSAFWGTVWGTFWGALLENIHRWGLNTSPSCTCGTETRMLKLPKSGFKNFDHYSRRRVCVFKSKKEKKRAIINKWFIEIHLVEIWILERQILLKFLGPADPKNADHRPLTQNFWVVVKIWVASNFGSKNLGQRKILGQRFWVIAKFWVRKKFRVKKFGSKNFESTFLGHCKNLGQQKIKS